MHLYHRKCGSWIWMKCLQLCFFGLFGTMLMMTWFICDLTWSYIIMKTPTWYFLTQCYIASVNILYYYTTVITAMCPISEVEMPHTPCIIQKLVCVPSNWGMVGNCRVVQLLYSKTQIGLLSHNHVVQYVFRTFTMCLYCGFAS